MADEKDDDMTTAERTTWLRERGVLVETPEERKAAEISKIMNEPDESVEGECTAISFVLVPADTSKPLQELSWNCPIQPGAGDRLAIHLKPIFNSLSAGKDVDISLLLKNNMTHNFASADAPAQVSEAALQQVAQEGSVETFSLVKPTPSNHFVTVNIYLDEAGMLKRLGLNTRATQFATRCGFNPPPTFYGDVFLGRIKSKPYIQNLPFCLGLDTDMHALWLQRATMENIEYQTAMNEITGRTDVQASKDGEDGIAKTEDGYSWTQTEDELELTISLPKGVASKEISVKYMPQAILVKCRNTEVLSLELFERVDPDGCTWTFDKDSDNPRLIITMEKSEQASWPRIRD